MGKRLTYIRTSVRIVPGFLPETIQSRKCRMKYLEALKEEKNQQPKILYPMKQKQKKSLKCDRKINNLLKLSRWR